MIGGTSKLLLVPFNDVRVWEGLEVNYAYERWVMVLWRGGGGDVIRTCQLDVSSISIHADRGPKLESDNDDVLPSAKRVKIDDGSDDVVIVDSGSTSPSSSSPVRSKPNPLSGKAGEVSRDRPPHFYLTKVRGIDSRYNLSDQAIGIKGIHVMCI